MDPRTFTPKQVIEGHLLASVKNDIGPLVYSKKVRKNAGFFAVLMLILTNVEFLGTLYKGSGGSENAVSYMRKYMGMVDTDYKEISGAIYHIWRHGTVHQRIPKKLRMNSRVVTGWALDKGYDNKAIKASQGVISISIPKFYEDFVASINLFLRDVEGSPFRARLLRKGWLKILEAEDWNRIKSRPYLTNKDYRFICKRTV